MAIDGIGNLIIGNKIDERGLLVFGKFNEFGHFAKASIVTIILTEIVNISETLNRTVTRNFTEIVNVAVNVLRTINKMFIESLTINEQTSRKVTRTYSIGVLISTSRTLKVTREFIEHLHVLDIFKRTFRCIFDESVNIGASLGSMKFTRNITTNIHISDTISKKFRKRILMEDLNISVITTRKFTRVLSEDVTISIIMTNIIQFIMKKLYSKVRGSHRGATLKLIDGRDAQ